MSNVYYNNPLLVSDRQTGWEVGSQRYLGKQIGENWKNVAVETPTFKETPGAI